MRFLSSVSPIEKRETMRVLTDVYLEAVRLLGEMEGGEETFDITTACHQLVRTDQVALTVEAAGGRDISPDDMARIEKCVMGIMVPFHHNLYFEHLLIEDGDDEALVEVYRDVAFTFITAWVQRFGGFNERLRKPGSSTLVDPTVDSVK